MDFRAEVAQLLDQVPRGRVTTFGDLGEALGDPRAAVAIYRLVEADRPPGWHRVVRSDGTLPFPEAAARLREEGVPVEADRVARLEGRRVDAFATSRPLRRLREEQKALARRVVLEDRLPDLETVAGFDVSYRGRDAYAAAVVLDWDTLEAVEEVGLRTDAPFPYVPTYLAYREWPPIARCYEALEGTPSLLLVDGNGTLHPAGFGEACYVGVKLDRPTVGVAKSLLLGTVAGNLEGEGSAAPVRHQGRVLGTAYRPRAGAKPIYVSPGHRVSLATALNVVRRLCRDRLPEPLRRADRRARAVRREAGA